MIHLFNRITEKENRLKLRRESTDAEKLLWNFVRNKKLNNLRIRRQYSVHKYVIDFYCPSCRLAIELDGEIHFIGKVQEHDRRREFYLRSLGITVLRIKNEDVFNDLPKVLIRIQDAAKTCLKKK